LEKNGMLQNLLDYYTTNRGERMFILLAFYNMNNFCEH